MKEDKSLVDFMKEKMKTAKISSNKKSDKTDTDEVSDLEVMCQELIDAIKSGDAKELSEVVEAILESRE